MPQTGTLGAPARPKVRIRMYRQGIGDCFLLTFNTDPEPRHILIDCGVLTGTPAGREKIREVAANIRKETSDKVDAVVATHEHWDHISGFYDAQDIFQQLQVRELWLAWTEDPKDARARELKQQQQLKLQMLHLALAGMAGLDDPRAKQYSQDFAGLLEFYGGPAETASLTAFSAKTAEAMKILTQLPATPVYGEPGDLITRDWLPGVRIYVLGPPRERTSLRQGQGKPGRETYGLVGWEKTFSAALERGLAVEEDLTDPQLLERIDVALPFHRSLQWRPEFLDKLKAKKDRTELENQCLQIYQAYMAEGAGWRRIGQDWLLSAVRLGLQLDNATNNTSLVLAFELTDTGQVLLFPGDAQIGSWLSWSESAWQVDGIPAGPGPGSAPKTARIEVADLLRRTVFYKVGHHGSHNATLREGGLELMTSPDLVAAIPVDQKFANLSKRWEMPAEVLLRRLQELTRGRVLRADALGPPLDYLRPPNLPPEAGLTSREWEHFCASVAMDPEGLFLDYFIT